jgi:hypothetical protein
VVSYFRVLDDALEITQNVGFFFATHSLQYPFKLVFIFSVDNTLSKHIRLNVLKTQSSLIESTALYNLNILVADDRFH